jgi:hypothetical protein
MGIDHAGHQRPTIAVDLDIHMLRGNFGFVMENLGDAIIFHNHCAGHRCCTGAIEYRNIAYQLPHRLLSRRSLSALLMRAFFPQE